MFIHKFGGHDHGEVGAWEAHINIEIRDEAGNNAAFATVVLSWGGTQPGRQALASDKDGKIDIRLGEFSDPAITLKIVDVWLDGFAYRPELNAASATLVVAGPN